MEAILKISMITFSLGVQKRRQNVAHKVGRYRPCSELTSLIACCSLNEFDYNTQGYADDLADAIRTKHDGINISYLVLQCHKLL